MSAVKRIIEIIPARPGWYARWRLPDATRCYPVTLWALLEGSGDESGREVIGMDSAGRWPGSAETEPDAHFIRYFFQPPEAGEPDDADPAERGFPRHVTRTPVPPPSSAEFEPDLRPAEPRSGAGSVPGVGMAR